MVLKIEIRKVLLELRLANDATEKFQTGSRQRRHRIDEHGNVGIKLVNFFAVTQFDTEAHLRSKRFNGFQRLLNFCGRSDKDLFLAVAEVISQKNLTRNMITEFEDVGAINKSTKG